MKQESVASAAEHRAPRYLSPARVCDKLSRKKSWLYDRMKNDATFPQPIRLGAWNVFIESEIDEWVVAQSQPARAAA